MVYCVFYYFGFKYFIIIRTCTKEAGPNRRYRYRRHNLSSLVGQKQFKLSSRLIEVGENIT